MLRVALPGGMDVALRPVGGEDEAWVLDSATDAVTPAVRATALLARCLAGAGDAADAERRARELTVGDREALLLHLRRATLGDVADSVLQCPATACGERMEIELRLSDLLLPRYPAPRREQSLGVDASGARYEIAYRIPTADDIDRAGDIARHDPERGALAILQRCVLRASRNGTEVPVDDLPPTVRETIADGMAAMDPQAEIELDLACPSCGTAFSVVFDTATYFLQELDMRASRLLHEVHLLATQYHWSERDILRLSPRRRAAYLELIAPSTARNAER